MYGGNVCLLGAGSGGDDVCRAWGGSYKNNVSHHTSAWPLYPLAPFNPANAWPLHQLPNLFLPQTKKEGPGTNKYHPPTTTHKIPAPKH
ncbi:hypothetical protein C4588_03880 [Candidatus Parcubacteria bacterium]|nr:MAG: hypothetical protein C4588_03880 [Candidatus Parcubacteria bacterium]